MFVARNPADWLYSATKLKNSNRCTDNLEKALEDYIAFYKEFDAHLSKNPIILEFDELVTDSELVLKKLCAKLGIEWNVNMKKTTLNNCLVLQNSSDDTNVYHYQPSTSFLGKGKNLDPSVNLIEARRRFDLMCDRKLK